MRATLTVYDTCTPFHMEDTMNKKTFACHLLLLASLCTACTADEPGEAKAVSPCLSGVQRTPTGFTSSCRVGFVFGGTNYGPMGLNHNMNIAMGCNDINSNVDPESDKMGGRIRLRMNDAANEVQIDAPAADVTVQASDKKDYLNVTTRMTRGGTAVTNEVLCEHLEDKIAELSKRKAENDRECKKQHTAAKSVSLPFTCRGLDDHLRSVGAFDRFNANKHQLAAALAANQEQIEILNRANPQKAAFVTAIATLLRNVLMGALGGLNMGVEYKDGKPMGSGSGSGDEVPGHYSGQAY